MTRRSNARIAGFTFLIYIAVALTGMVLSSRASSGVGTAAKLASIAQHVPTMRLAILLELVGCFCAFVLAGTLYAITRDQDQDLALLALTLRVAEGVIGAVALQRPLGKLWLATVGGADAPDPAAAQALGAYLLKLPSWGSDLPATFFAVGSLLFAWLLLRGRIVPVALAWLGVLASILVVGGPSPGARRGPRAPVHRLHVDPDARLRAGARSLADHQGGSPAAAEADRVTGPLIASVDLEAEKRDAAVMAGGPFSGTSWRTAWGAAKQFFRTAVVILNTWGGSPCADVSLSVLLLSSSGPQPFRRRSPSPRTPRAGTCRDRRRWPSTSAASASCSTAARRSSRTSRCATA